MKKLSLRTVFACVTGVLLLSVQALAGGEDVTGKAPFYRVLEGPNPGPRQAAIDRFIYGAEILYTGDAEGRKSPIRVKGTVWHNSIQEAKLFLGTHNPVLNSLDIVKRLENNKWEEAKLFMARNPDMYPRTELLAELFAKLSKEQGLDFTRPAEELLPKIEQALRSRYPNGFFLKPISGFNSDGTFPTEKTDFVEVFKAYQRDVKPELLRLLKELEGDTDLVHLELKSRPNYSGRVIDDFLTRPDTVIIQEKIQAKMITVMTPEGPVLKPSEFRSHTWEGVIKEGAAQTRWEDIRGVDEKSYRRVRAAERRFLKNLLPEERIICSASDWMEDIFGKWWKIEGNLPGSDSSYLYADTDIWVANLLAEHYGGHATVLKEFREFAAQPTLQAKEAALARLLKRPELAALIEEVAPMTELYTRAKSVILDEYRRMPTGSMALDVVMSLRRFNLQPYLTAAEIETLVGAVRNSGAVGRMLSLGVLGDNLKLEPNEILFVSTEGRIRLLHGLSYEDAAVRDALKGELAQRVQSRGGRVSSARLVAEARSLVDERIVTRAELSASKVAPESIARDIASRASGGQARLYYAGTRSALVRELVRSLLR